MDKVQSEFHKRRLRDKYDSTILVHPKQNRVELLISIGVYFPCFIFVMIKVLVDLEFCRQ